MINLELVTSIEEISKLPIWKFGERVERSEPAGESNMNVVLRITTNQRSVILKQSKPYVRKYPQIEAPIERISVEYAFYEAANQNPILKNFSPKVLDFLPDEHLLVTEDLGKGIDFSEIYSGKIALKKLEIQNLCDYLNALHELEVKDFPSNNAMKILNHEHLFRFPFLVENGFDLDSIQHGLQDLSLKYKNNSTLKRKIEQLGKRYLSQGDTLLHGDFYPGSWLKVGNEIKIIDPEFGFLGDPEFDLGVLFAHFELGQQSKELKDEFLQSYIQPLSPKLLDQYQGVEILRRLIGIAQLPLNLTLEEKEKLMNRAVELILE
ncbi:phosphotransferase [Algoriphagus sp.]|uniref:phosphotransferase n=1 Tax=Algoriphagus sp. TaxID=1872435 RepID=UPI0025D13CF3|nr:phosphotransferase [Algoriphagus sp.]